VSASGIDEARGKTAPKKYNVAPDMDDSIILFYFSFFVVCPVCMACTR